MSSSKRWLRGALALALAMGALPAARAQTPTPEAEALRQAINEIKEEKLAAVLALPADENAAFIEMYNQWEETRWSYRERRGALLEELQLGLINPPGAGGRSLAAILDNLDACDAESRQAEDRLRVEFRRVLSDEQYAKLLLFENNFAKNLRRLVQDQQKDAGAPAYKGQP